MEIMYSPSHRARRRWRIKQRERNLASAICGMAVIAALSTALAQPRWFSVKGGGCKKDFIGLSEFFYSGVFLNNIEDGNMPMSDRSLWESSITNTNDRIDYKHKAGGHIFYQYSPSKKEVLRDCVTPKIVQLIRVVIALCFLGILSSLFAFILDTFGVMQRVLRLIRRNAIGNILTVFFCVTIIGFCYWITTLMEIQQTDTRIIEGSKVEIKFDVSFYLVTTAGGLAVIATATNLLRRHPPDEEQHTDSLLEDFDGMETFFVGPHDIAPINYMPPPPYSP